MNQLKRYHSRYESIYRQCPKEVEAFKIAAIAPSTVGGALLYFCVPIPVAHLEEPVLESVPYNCVSVSREWMLKHSPKVGGYYVRYKDGYESWSPAEAFEDGYTLIEDEPVMSTGDYDGEL